MPQKMTSATTMELDDFIRVYEQARRQGGKTDLKAFLPEPGHPLYLPVLKELVRVDLEFGWEEGQPRPLDDYQLQFPEVFRDPQDVLDITFEEYRLRQQAGQNPAPVEYQRRYGVNPAHWPRLSPEGEALPKSWTTYPLQAEYMLERPVRPAAFPEVGSHFLGFYLIAELGRGAFGRVYLARQGDLANRPVALKIAPHVGSEPQTLAQLQHTHIVPIYSVHQAGSLQVVCMPYLGATTLANLLRNLQNRQSLPQSGVELVHMMTERESPPQRQEPAASVPLAATAPAAPLTLPSPPTVGGEGRVRGAAISSTEQSCTQVPGGLEKLTRLTYVEAILWIGARLADGLAHAHERGILHRDLKPANVLLTDDGQPMLLDFNLSAVMPLNAQAPSAQVGGTLPYMAPEHLEAFQGTARSVDARSDIYSLGVILYELLSGRHPFPLPPTPLPIRYGERDRGEGGGPLLPAMIQDRRGCPPPLRCWNLAVSPAAEAIVRHCLEPDPAQRYQSAVELREDLRRHLDHLPLQHAPEPLGERVRKWIRRHPRLTSSTTVGGFALVLLMLGATIAMLEFRRRDRLHLEQQAQQAQLEAAHSLHQFRQEMKSIRFLLTYPDIGPRELAEGITRCLALLKPYQVLESPRWQEQTAVTLLSAADQQRLREEIGELLWLLAQAVARQEKAPDGESPILFACRLNELAESCYPPDRVPRVLWLQRAHLTVHLSGQEVEAWRLQKKAQETPLRSSQDHYMLGLDHYRQGEFLAARRLLRQVSRQDPQNYYAWLVLGHCHAVLGEQDRAVACYGTSIALWPDFSRTYYLRGRAYLDLGNFEEAQADFDETVRLQPKDADAHLHRALVRLRLKNAAGAIDDLNQALDLGARFTRIYFIRAEARHQLGDREGARRDREEGLQREPQDEQSWIVRGLARLGGNDSAGALADFEQALKLNPASRDALQNKAHVLSERRGGAEQAIQVLDRAVALYPDYVPARAGRGVLLARLGRREAALQDAEESLRRDTTPANLYQVAGIYALTSQQNEEDRLRAFQLLSAALRHDYGFDLIGTDPDLDPVRNRPEFGRLVQAAQALRSADPPKGPGR